MFANKKIISNKISHLNSISSKRIQFASLATSLVWNLWAIFQVWKGGNKMQIGKMERQTGKLQSNWIFMRSAFGCTLLATDIMEKCTCKSNKCFINTWWVCRRQIFDIISSEYIKRSIMVKDSLYLPSNSISENEIKGRRPKETLAITSNRIIASAFAPAWL